MSTNNSNNSNNSESFKVKGEDLLKEIKKLFHEGNVRKIMIKNEKGNVTYIEIPLTIGVIGTLLLPALAAVGALAAMVGLVTVEVVKEGEKKNVSPRRTSDKKTSSKKTTKTPVRSIPKSSKAKK
jgi:hypothetical protein